MKGFLKFLGILLVILLLLVLGVYLLVIYLTPKSDLGIKYSKQEAETFLQENQISTKSTECIKECSPKYSGVVTIEKEISNEVGSSLINKWYEDSRNAPFQNAQMKVYEDGTIEFTSSINVEKLSNLLSISTDIPQDQKKIVLDFVKALGNTFPIYSKGKLNIEKNNVDLNISSLNVGPIPIASGLLTEYKGQADSYVENRIKYINGLNIEKLEFKEGKTIFKGSIPKEFEYGR